MTDSVDLKHSKSLKVSLLTDPPLLLRSVLFEMHKFHRKVVIRNSLCQNLARQEHNLHFDYQMGANFSIPNLRCPQVKGPMLSEQHLKVIFCQFFPPLKLLCTFQDRQYLEGLQYLQSLNFQLLEKRGPQFQVICFVNVLDLLLLPHPGQPVTFQAFWKKVLVI